jgi:sulfate permease, SulP family
VDVTAARVLVTTYHELQAQGSRLVLARAVGQVRDVLRCVTDESDLTASYPTIQAAVDAFRGVAHVS